MVVDTDPTAVSVPRARRRSCRWDPRLGRPRVVSEERQRVETFGKLEDGLTQASDWYLWGPYLSERQWGTVREDYSADGEAWDYLPHDHARSRAYRWSEDGLAGFCDVEQRLCLALALVERSGPDPQGADLRTDRLRRATTARTPRSTGGTSTRCRATRSTGGATTTRRGRSPTTTWSRRTPGGASTIPSTSCSTPARSTTTATGSSRSTTPRPTPTDLLMTVRVTNAGPEADTLHVLPDGLVPQHLVVGRRRPDRRSCAAGDGVDDRDRPPAVRRARAPGRRRARRRPRRRCSSATTRPTPPGSTATPTPIPYPEGRHQRPRRRRRRHGQPRARQGTKAACWYRVEVAAGRHRRAAAAAPSRRRDAEDRRRGARQELRQGRRRSQSRRPTTSTPS